MKMPELPPMDTPGFWDANSIRTYCADVMASFYADGFSAGLELAAEICAARVMGDNNREDGEAKRCAAAIREASLKVPDKRHLQS
jgi:hypothetical protein